MKFIAKLIIYEDKDEFEDCLQIVKKVEFEADSLLDAAHVALGKINEESNK